MNNIAIKPLPINEVIVMDDGVTAQETIIEILEREFDLHVKLVNSKEEAIDIAEQHQEIQGYILDVHMGNDRQQEGLHALEEIKAINEKSFVSILTGHPTLAIQRMALRLGADLYREKSTDLENDIRYIGSQIKKRHRDSLQEHLQTIDRLREDIINKLKKINELEKLYLLQEQLQAIDQLREDIINKLKKISELEKLYNSPSTSLLLKDVNIGAYEKLKLDEEWLAKYTGKYVAFIDGLLINSDEDEQKLLEQLKTPKYRDKPIFLTKVEEHPTVIDLPSSLWFDDF